MTRIWMGFVICTSRKNFRVVGCEITPSSVNRKFIASQTSKQCSIPPVSPVGSEDSFQEIKAEEDNELFFTYSVKWKPSNVRWICKRNYTKESKTFLLRNCQCMKDERCFCRLIVSLMILLRQVRWASRWDVYLQMTDPNIHWFSIINSVVVVLFLTGGCDLTILDKETFVAKFIEA